MIYYDDDVLMEEIPRSLYNNIILFEKYFPRIRSIPTNNYYDKKKCYIIVILCCYYYKYRILIISTYSCVFNVQYNSFFREVPSS